MKSKAVNTANIVKKTETLHIEDVSASLFYQVVKAVVCVNACKYWSEQKRNNSLNKIEV